MKKLQAVSGITALVCMILMQMVSEELAKDLFGLVIICTPVFLYVSHIIGLENQDKKGGTRG